MDAPDNLDLLSMAVLGLLKSLEANLSTYAQKTLQKLFDFSLIMAALSAL